MNVIHYIIFILFFLIIYSVCFKTVEGFDDDFYYYNKLIDYKTIPPSFVNDATPSRTVNKFGFYKGKGTFKKGYTKDIKTDEKISTLNKLLNRLLGRIVSDNQDCVGSFGKYSECDKSCGSNSFQTRKYNITQERGKNGKDCPFVDGYEEKIICDLDECQIGDICKSNEDCETGNCNPNSTRCENMVPCDSENVHVCNETQCMQLNEEYDNNVMQEGFYMYNNVDEECFFKTPAEIEELNLNVFTYDYRTISDQVKDAVLECEYYQVKKDDVGPCINGSNIMVNDNDEPICKPGYGPEPTIFNGLNACQKCIIDSEDRIAGEECLCKNGGIYNNASQTCEGETTRDTSDNLCEENSDDPMWFVRKYVSEEECAPCLTGYQFRKNGSVVSCVACPAGSNTFSSTYCNPEDSGNLLDVCKDAENFKQNYLVKMNGDPWSESLERDDYYEKCITGLETEASSLCGDYQTRIGDHCICTGENMNSKPPDCNSENIESCPSYTPDSQCTTVNCLEGYRLNSDGSCALDGCGQALHCREGAEDDDCYKPPGEETGNKKCLSCKQGYELSTDTGVCDSCSPGYQTTGSYPDLTCTECEQQEGCGTPGETCLSDGTLDCETCESNYYRDEDGRCQSDMMINKSECIGLSYSQVDSCVNDNDGRGNCGSCSSSFTIRGSRRNCGVEMASAASQGRDLSCSNSRASRDYQPGSFENECCQRPVGYPTSRIQIREDKGAIWNTIKDCTDHHTNQGCDNCSGHTGEVCMAKNANDAYECGVCGINSCLLGGRYFENQRRDCICSYNGTC